MGVQQRRDQEARRDPGDRPGDRARRRTERSSDLADWKDVGVMG
jgi:hypothetical protein